MKVGTDVYQMYVKDDIFSHATLFIKEWQIQNIYYINKQHKYIISKVVSS